jgi:hypothetical protein
MDFFVGMDIDVDIITNLIEPLDYIYELPIQNEPVSLEPVPMEIDIYIPITAPLIRTMSSPF